MSDVQQHANLLERKLKREKLARMAAEKQLEEYSLQVYQSQISLQQSYHQAKKREAELQFLADLSASSGMNNSVDDLLAKTVELSTSFLQGVGGYIIHQNQSNLFDIKRGKWEYGATSIEHFQSVLNDVLPELSESWLVLSVDDLEDELAENDTSEFVNVKWLLFMNVPMLDGSLTGIALMLQSEYLDEENLYVMETARRHLLNGVKRRNNERDILNRSQQLQQALHDLEVAQQQLVNSEKMASLGQLSAGIAHEINNPLSYVKSNLESLQEYLGQIWQYNDDIQAALNRSGDISKQTYDTLVTRYDVEFLKDDSIDIMKSLLNGIARVREIIGDLKTFSHSGEVAFELLSVHDCIESALKIAWNSLKYDFTIEKDIQDGLPLILGNKGQLQQVLVNLFVNAGQAMEREGTLGIHASQQGKHLVVKVSDTGCGMSKAVLNKLFTPFFTTKAVGVGTGLGLSVSYGILKSHNADVAVESVEGEGTTFTITLPIPEAK